MRRRLPGRLEWRQACGSEVTWGSCTHNCHTKSSWGDTDECLNTESIARRMALLRDEHNRMLMREVVCC